MIPCPLTLFVMTTAISRGVPEAGVAFAAVMVIGVALVLATVALAAAAVLFRRQLLRLLATGHRVVDTTTGSLQVVSGLIFVAVAWNAVLA
jgi:ABC-type nickel/cobalt efflux system permease component RcnA